MIVRVNWKKLVASVQADGEKFDDLWAVLRPHLRKFAVKARRHAWGDFIATSKSSVWLAVRRIDLDRRTTREIRSYLIATGINAMRDELRKERVLADLDTTDGREEEIAIPLRRKPAAAVHADPSPFLTMYLKFIREHGKIRGAHKIIAARLGISAMTCSRRFYRQGRAWARRGNAE